MRISDWSSDVCSSDLKGGAHQTHQGDREKAFLSERVVGLGHAPSLSPPRWRINSASAPWPVASTPAITRPRRSEEHTSELQSLMRISYAVFCLQTKKK